MEEHEEDPFDIIWKKYLAKFSRLLNVRSFFNLLLFMVGVLLTRYAHHEYSSGGCDGGLCGIFLIIHGFPFLISWIMVWLLWVTQPSRIFARVIWTISVVLNLIATGVGYSAELDSTLVSGIVVMVAQAYLAVRIFSKP